MESVSIPTHPATAVWNITLRSHHDGEVLIFNAMALSRAHLDFGGLNLVLPRIVISQCTNNHAHFTSD
jgi:hypothetical protein